MSKSLILALVLASACLIHAVPVSEENGPTEGTEFEGEPLNEFDLQEPVGDDKPLELQTSEKVGWWRPPPRAPPPYAAPPAGIFRCGREWQHPRVCTCYGTVFYGRMREGPGHGRELNFQTMTRSRFARRSVHGSVQCSNGVFGDPLWGWHKQCFCQGSSSPPRVDCQWRDNGWGNCNKSCGGGQQTFTRSVTRWPQNGGRSCPRTSETRSCNTHQCPVDCQWRDNGWGKCSKTCGGGQQTFTRSITRNASGGGRACPRTSESRSCNTHQCPVDCQVGAWQPFGACSKQCGGGSQARTRSLVQPRNGGKACPAASESRACNTQGCAVHCKVGAWQPFGACSKQCGGGSQSRTRSLTAPENGGKECPEGKETRQCNTQPCPVDCKVGAFGEFGACTQQCGGGIQARTRSLTEPENGGKACPAASESRACNTQACTPAPTPAPTKAPTAAPTRAPTNAPTAAPTARPTPAPVALPVDCEITTWYTGPCSKSCGDGVATSTRTVTKEARNGGKCEAIMKKEEKCNVKACVIQYEREAEKMFEKSEDRKVTSDECEADWMACHDLVESGSDWEAADKCDEAEWVCAGCVDGDSDACNKHWTNKDGGENPFF